MPCSAVSVFVQSNLTTAFGVQTPDLLPHTLHELLTMGMAGRELPPPGEYILKKEVGSIPGAPMGTPAAATPDLLPASLNLSVTELNLRDELDGVLITMTAEHTLLHREAMALIDENFTGSVEIFDARIPMTVNPQRFMSLRMQGKLNETARRVEQEALERQETICRQNLTASPSPQTEDIR